jgi:hypothetical protein
MRFLCSICGEEAGTVTVEDGTLRRVSFTGELQRPGWATPLPDDPAALFALDFELAPFWCPDCHAVYCGTHWQHWLVFDHDPLPAWLDSIRGRCPHGHERTLED